MTESNWNKQKLLSTYVVPCWPATSVYQCRISIILLLICFLGILRNQAVRSFEVCEGIL